jgi:hypothetical protein
MNKCISILGFLILFNPIVIGQNTTPKQDNFEKARLKNTPLEEFFGQNTGFPEYLLSEKGDANVIVSFIITKTGQIDSVKIIKSPNKDASIQALSALDKSDNLWEPTKLNDQPIDWRYIASFKFVTSLKYDNQKKKIQKLVQKEKYVNSLELLDECIKFHEYDEELYQLRSSIYTKLNKRDLAESDLRKIEFIERNLIIDIWVTVMGIPR